MYSAVCTILNKTVPPCRSLCERSRRFWILLSQLSSPKVTQISLAPNINKTVEVIFHQVKLQPCETVTMQPETLAGEDGSKELAKANLVIYQI